MDKKYKNGFAFILEGDTEKEFYYSFLEYLCQKHNITLSKSVDNASPDISYILRKGDEVSLVKFDVVGTISQVPRAGNWFNIQCLKKYGKDIKWYVFLCYDTDDYKENISKFYEGDWSVLRTSLQKAEQIIDIAAAADIEDVMLQDIDNVCKFIGCEPPELLKGGKGKIKLKKLFREHGKYYHEGTRAKDLICSLNMEKLINDDLVPLKEIEQALLK